MSTRWGPLIHAWRNDHPDEADALLQESLAGGLTDAEWDHAERAAAASWAPTVSDEYLLAKFMIGPATLAWIRDATEGLPAAEIGRRIGASPP